MVQTVPYVVVSTTTINRRKDGSVSFWKGVIDRGDRHQAATASNKVGQAAILAPDEKTVWLPADLFTYSDVSNARRAVEENAKDAVRKWDGLDIRALAAAFIAAREYCTPFELETLAYQPCLRGQGWQGAVPPWDGIVAADVTGAALVWSDADFVAVRQIPVDQEDIPAVEAPKPLRYKMRPADITSHYREVCSLLTRHDIDAEARAKICGLAAQTLKCYGALDGTSAHRKIPVEKLNLLREAAMDAYWEAAADPYRTQVKHELGDDGYVVPSLIALCNGMARERHPHPLRVLERADNLGGHVIDTHGAPFAVELDEAASLRSRWRKGAHRCSWPDTDGYLTRTAFLCHIADCCPYYLWRIGSEYYPWAIQPTSALVEWLEDAILELEMPEKGAAA